jgi:AcrR family transcriptional regulator
MDNEPSPHRVELREALLAAATRVIAQHGYSALRARDLAAEVGCAVGSIYNVFPDIDALILAVKAQTLDALEADVIGRLGPFEAKTPKDAAARFLALGRVYVEFADRNWRLWSAAFEHQANDSPALETYMVRLDAILTNIELPLRALLPRLEVGESRLLARALFASVHGVVSLGLGGKLGPIAIEQLHWQVQTMLAATLRGLSAELREGAIHPSSAASLDRP